jgi:hypothetical protein
LSSATLMTGAVEVMARQFTGLFSSQTDAQTGLQGPSCIHSRNETFKKLRYLTDAIEGFCNSLIFI